VAARLLECGFEFFRGHGCLSLVNAVCFQVEVSAMGRSFVQGSLTECMFMSLSVIRCSGNPLHLQKVGREKSALSPPPKKKKKKRKEERICVKFKPFGILLQVDW